jgi:hypothetical protein
VPQDWNIRIEHVWGRFGGPWGSPERGVISTEQNPGQVGRDPRVGRQREVPGSKPGKGYKRIAGSWLRKRHTTGDGMERLGDSQCQGPKDQEALELPQSLEELGLQVPDTVPSFELTE